jgi:uncharacterized Zn finger protein
MGNICKLCQGDLSFISYKIDKELEVIYLTYRCDDCGEIIEETCDNTDDKVLRVILNSNNAYDRFMF